MRADSDHGLNSSRPTSHHDPVTDAVPSHGPTLVGDGGVPNSRPYPPTSTSACKRARMHQSNAWFDSTTGRPVRASSALIAPAARNPVPPMNTASASSPTWLVVHSVIAQGSMRPGSFGSSADPQDTTSNPWLRKYAAPRSFSSSSNHGG